MFPNKRSITFSNVLRIPQFKFLQLDVASVTRLNTSIYNDQSSYKTRLRGTDILIHFVKVEGVKTFFTKQQSLRIAFLIQNRSLITFFQSRF